MYFPRWMNIKDTNIWKMFFTAVYGCSVWSDNLSAKHKLEVTGLKKKGDKRKTQQWYF